MTHKLARLSAPLLGVLIAHFAVAVSAQPAASNLTGRVTDQTDAVIADARITATNTATGTEWSSRSDAEGRFTLQLLPPGTYDMKVAAGNFAEWQARGLELNVGQTSSVDVRMTATVVADVIVPARTREISIAIDGVLDASQIAALPLNGRNFLELAFLVPGNQPTPTFDPTKTNSVLVSSAGQLGRGGNVMLDGQDNNDDVVGGPLLNLPIDAVQEFQIATSRYAADLGRSGSSAINIVSRSGANVMHGSASLFARDGAWQAPRDAGCK